MPRSKAAAGDGAAKIPPQNLDAEMSLLGQRPDVGEFRKRYKWMALTVVGLMTVLVGKLADRFNGGASYAPCFTPSTSSIWSPYSANASSG